MQVGSTLPKMIRCLPNYQNSKSCSYRALPQTLITAQRKAGTKLTCWAELSCRKCNRSIAAFRQGRGAKPSTAGLLPAALKSCDLGIPGNCPAPGLLGGAGTGSSPCHAPVLQGLLGRVSLLVHDRPAVSYQRR